MDTEDAIVRLLDEHGPIARRLPGYAPRRAQIDMALEVARALREPGGRLVAEAGTGTGKSLAYLSAALLSDQQVVVATGTKALQDQLIQKDIPLVLDALRELCGLDKRAALMKGRANYLCLARYEHFEREPRFAFADEATAWPAIRAWAGSTSTGDRAEIESLPDTYLTWSDLDASSEICVGQRCPQYADCFVTRMRQRAEAADLIVVNHHLLCADQRVRLEGLPAASEAPGEDLSAGGFAQVIPTADALIVDEAHALSDVATEYFGVSLASTRVERLLRDLRKAADGLPSSRRLAILGAGTRVQAAFDELYRALEPYAAGPGSGPSSDRARLQAAQARALSERRTAAVETTDELSSLLEALAETPKDGAVATWAISEVEGLRRRADQVAEELAFLLGPALEDTRFVTFVEGKRRGLSLGAVPIDVADALARTLFGGLRPVVLTSATLAVAGDTRSFEEKVGLRLVARPGEAAGDDDEDDDEPAIRSVVYPSPFDHRRRAALYAPAGMPEPDHPAFAERFDEELSFLLGLANGGALVLFTSHRAMEAAHGRLAPSLMSRGLVVHKQGDMPKARLLEELRAATGDRGAVLFATHSFWEGVDVRGRALRLVVIDRLPFRIPTDPVQVARQELVRARGGHPFQDLSLPEAAITLKQGTGRLLRSTDDAGVVAILDGRLRKRAYGRVLLETLPPMTRIGSQKALTEFWTRFVAPVLDLPTAGAKAEGKTSEESPC